MRVVYPGDRASGGFNMNQRDEDKDNDNLHRRMTGRFCRFLNDCELKELYLHGRRYTWSNERGAPTPVKLDRVLCMVGWDCCLLYRYV